MVQMKSVSSKTIDPSSLSRPDMVLELMRLVEGVQSKGEAEERIRSHFRPKPEIWIQGSDSDSSWIIALLTAPRASWQKYSIFRKKK